MYKMVSVILASLFFTVYGNNVVLTSDKNIELIKTKSKVAKSKHEKPQIYGGERTNHRELISTVKTNKKVIKNISNKGGNDQSAPKNLIQEIKPAEGTVVKEERFSPKPLNVGPRASILETRFSTLNQVNSRDGHDTHIFISEYCDYQPSGYTGARFIEIYNPTSQDVLLGDDDNSYYFVARYANGGTSSFSIALSGTIAAGDVYVVANNQDKFVEVFGFEADQYSSTISGNGDDTFTLTTVGYPASNDEVTAAIFDILGEVGVDGSGTAWDHLDQTIVRNPGYGASTTWAAEAWSIGAGTTDFATPGTHIFMEENEGPYLSEGFEGDVFPPSGWDMVSYDDYGYVTTAGWASGDGSDYGPGLPNSGSGAAYYNVYDYYWDAYSTLITPSVDLSGATAPKLSFYVWDPYHSSSYGYALEVSISTDAGASFGAPVYTTLGTDGWEKVDIDLSSYVGQSIHVAFKSTSDYGSSNPHLDDISIAEPPAYPIAEVSTEIIDFGVIKVLDTKTQSFSVTNSGGGALNWTAVSDGSEFTISSASGSIEPGSVADLSVTYSPVDYDAIDTAYIVITHDADTSPDSVMLVGAAHNDLYRTSFEEPWSAAVPGAPSSPPGWSRIQVSGAGGWGQYSYFNATDGGSVARAYYSFSNSADSPGEDLLISPALDLSEGDTGFRLTFDVLTASYSATKLQVQISSQNTDASSGWTTLEEYVYGDNLLSSSTWYEQSISLSDYSDGTYYIGLRMLDENGFYVYVDDIKVEALPATAELSVEVANIQYPATNLDSTVSETITLTNSGAVTLTGTITYPDGFSGPADFSTDTSVDIAISYAPTTAGIHSGSVIINSNGGDASIEVSGAAGGSVATWDIDYDGDGYEDWPLNWEWINNDGGSNEWFFIGGYARTGTGSAAARYEFTGANDDWLVSPQLDVIAGDKFVFFARGFSSFYDESFNVMLSTTGGNDVSSFDVTLLTDTVRSASYIGYEIDLSSYVGTQPRIAIQYTANDQYYFFVDDIATSSVYTPAGASLTDYYSSVSYGNVLAGESSSFTWDYINGGGSNLEVTAVEFSSGPFSLSADVTLPIVTTSGAVGSFDIVFSPPTDVDSIYSTTMTVTHNGGDDIVVSLSGRGLVAAFFENFNAGLSLPTGWTTRDNTSDGAWEINDEDGESNFLYHNDGFSGVALQNDTVVTSVISLPPVVDYHYELEFSEYIDFGTFANYSGISISQDGGLTWTEIYGLSGSAEHGPDGWNLNVNVDLSEYDGDVHLAFVYIGSYQHGYGLDDITIQSKQNPIIPILSTSKMFFPATAIGEESTSMLYITNSGSPDYSGTITYPDGLSGETNVTGLAFGITDSIAVTYAPTNQGVVTGSIVFDGSSSGAEEVSVPVEANAGAQVGTFQGSWIGWNDYSFSGQPWNGTPDEWLWFLGDGHNSDSYAGIYTYEPRWGEANDFMVSPKLEVSAGDIFSFWGQGGYVFDCDYGASLGIDLDSIAVWISSEKPVVGINEEGVDTGFVNTDAFTLLGEGKPSCDTWDSFSYDLSSYSDQDAWLLIQAAKGGYLLKVDDVGYPKMYMNPNPVLYVGTKYDFGVTQPTGDSVRYYLRNTGLQDLIIDSMNFVHGDYFDVDYLGVGDFPVTIVPGGIDSIVVYWMPEMEGVQTDTLVYYSNYTVGDYDAYGRGTDRSVFIADAFNNPPNATNLVAPAPDTELIIDGSNAEGSTQIIWQNATDPDGYPIEYILELIVENTSDTLDTMITNNIFNLSHAEILEYMEESAVTSLDITWDVYTSDGFDEVESSNGPWGLSIDGGWALSVEDNTIPDVFALHNNYPNPFNPITNIKYDVPELSDVKIDIYNIAGNKIKTLVSREHQPGRYKIQWNATNEQGAPVATGMYIYKIRANDFISVKKLLLMK